MKFAPTCTDEARLRRRRPALRTLFATALAAVLVQAGLPSEAAAQAYPNRPVRVVVAFPPGGATDVLGRIIAGWLSERLGQQFVVDNRSGAGGITGSDYVVKSPADGYTLLVGAAGTIGINPGLYKSMPYDTLRDLVAVAPYAASNNLLVVPPGVAAKNVQELIALARSQPGQLTFASASSGSSQHLSGEMFKMMAKVDMLHVPYRGSAQAMGDLLSGRVNMMFDNLPSVLPHVQAGKLRALGVTGPTRSPALPDVPTIAEQGLPDYSATTWFGLFAPAATPPAIVAQLNREVSAGVADPQVAARLRASGAEPMTMSSDEFGRFVRAEIAKWAAVIKASGAKVD